MVGVKSSKGILYNFSNVYGIYWAVQDKILYIIYTWFKTGVHLYLNCTKLRGRAGFVCRFAPWAPILSEHDGRQSFDHADRQNGKRSLLSPLIVHNSIRGEHLVYTMYILYIISYPELVNIYHIHCWNCTIWLLKIWHPLQTHDCNCCGLKWNCLDKIYIYIYFPVALVWLKKWT